MSEWALVLAIVMLAILDLMIVYITPPLAQLLTVQRIQSLSKPDDVMMAEDTYMLIRDHYKCTKTDTVVLHGHKHATTLYKVENDQDNWRANTITASSDGYRFFLTLQR